MGTLTWWQRGVIYEVYVLSFMDADGDGVGDLEGVIARLDHLRWLGVDALWLSPIYPSPKVDNGYDIADYRDIDPDFGDLSTFDRLINEAHRRDLRVVLDFVPNHTSDRHPWFLSSRARRDSDKRDWYIWRPAKDDGGPPNNWVSVFGDSAWTWDAASGEYYLHSFAPEQPDLNLRNPAVVAELHNALRFWLDRGVDGFRVDAVSRLIKDDQLRDNPRNPKFRQGDPPDQVHKSVYNTNRPEVHKILAGFRTVLDKYRDRLLIGESYLPVEKLIPYYGKKLGGLHLPLNLNLLQMPWRARVVADHIERYERALPEGAWPNWAVGNHDQSRVTTRLGLEQARTAAMALFTLRGTPFVYYGDEIGMTDTDVPPATASDPQGSAGGGNGFQRDAVRTPMQWEGGENAGFTTGTPWLPVAGNVSEINVKSERGDPHSMLSLYRRLIELRRTEPALIEGTWSLLAVKSGVMLYVRALDDARFLVALNMTDEPLTILLPEPDHTGQIRLNTLLDRDGEDVRDEIALRADEGVIIALDPPHEQRPAALGTHPTAKRL